MQVAGLRLAARHAAFYIAGTIGVVVGGITAFVALEQALAVGIDAFFIAYLALAFRQIPKMSSDYLRSHADETDAPVAVIFGSTVLAVGIAVASLFQLINGGGNTTPLQLVTGAGSVVLGWFVINTMTAQHYAFEYYAAPNEEPAKQAHPKDRQQKKAVAEGFKFATQGDPNGMSFIYMSYVIGMTAQVSDFSVTTPAMQKIVTIHSVFSFFFNTVIIAATVNIAVSLGSG